MAATPLDDERLTMVGLLFEAHDGLVQRLSPQLASNGLPQGEFEALLRLARTPDRRLRMSDLAAQLRLSTSGVTRLVDRLERRGLIVRHACESDGRGLYAVLTPPGFDLVNETVKGHLPLVEQWFTGVLEPDELTALAAALRKVRDVVHPNAAAGAAEVSTTAS